MDKVSLSNPLLIVVIGLPGSGKSFFATQFADSLNAALVSEDKIRWMLFSHHTYNDNENKVVKQIADVMTTELLKTKKIFVLDGGYGERATRTALAAGAKKAGYTLLTVVVQTDLPTARQRSLKRSATRSGDIYKQSLNAETFAMLEKKYQPPLRVDKNTVVISGKHTYSTQARTVLKKMLEVHGLAATEERPAIARPRGPFVQ